MSIATSSYEELAEAQRRQRILSDITVILLDYTGSDEVEPLRRVVDRVVEGLGDWCAFSLVDADGILRPAIAYHPDPRQRALADRLADVMPSQRWDAGPAAMNPLVLGNPVVLEEIPDAMLRAGTPSEEAYRLYRDLRLTSVIVAPLRSGSEPLGVLTLASSGAGGRRYSQNDLDFVNAISSRASLAVRNARLTRALSAERDEAERRAAELLAVLAASPSGIALYGADDRLKYVSPRLSELLGYPVEPSVGQHYGEVAPGPASARGMKDEVGFFARFTELFADRERTLSDELEFSSPSFRVLQRVSVPVHGAAGAYLGRLFVFNDVTRERALDRQRSEFLTVAAHELRTPLTPIAMHLQSMARRLARGGGVDPQMVAKAQKQVGRLADLIDDLLNFSRLEAGRLDLHPERLSLDALVSDVVSDFRALGGPHELVYRAPEQPLSVYGDPARLQQVVVNLVQNAIKYSPSGGRVVVEVAEAEGEARVSVTDQGIGIPQEEQAHLFERYFRAHNATSANFGGLGIGLFLSNDIVKRHHGRFEVHSAPHQGSSFTFFLPLAEPPARTPRPARRRVLLAEDDPAIREAICGVLEEEGYVVDEARNGAIALEVLRRTKPDLLLVDLMMPVLDGAGFLRRLREERLASEVPVVIVSADRSSKDRLQQLGAQAYLRKPIDLDDLLRVVQQYVGDAQPATH